MHKLIKSSTVFVLVISIILLLSGCGTKQQLDSNVGSAGQNGSSSQTSSKTAETIELTISAAASLTDALKEIQHSYESTHTGIQLNFNFGGSGALENKLSKERRRICFCPLRPKT